MTNTETENQALHTMGVTLKDGRYYAKNGQPLPQWWSPDRQTAWRVVSLVIRDDNGPGHIGALAHERFVSFEEAEAASDDFGQIDIQRITCDLMTGEEIPA